MKKLALAALVALSLAGCNEGNIIRQKDYVVVVPPRELFDCPVVKKYPNPATLTDVEFARLALKLNRNNKVCAKNMDLIDQFLEQAAKDISEGKKVTVE